MGRENAGIAQVRGLSLTVIGILLIGVLFWLASRMGIGLPQDADSSAGDMLNDSPQSAPGEDVVPVWKAWQKPQLALMITGEQHGYFEPCGCTSNQMGGMARRADLLNKLTDAGWEVRGVDLGGLARRSVHQAEIKYETSLRALHELKYVAAGLSPEDLRLRTDFLLTQDLQETGDDNALRLVSANIVFFGDPNLGTPTPTRIFEAGGRRVGITSVMSDSTKSEVIAEGSNSDLSWSEVSPAIKTALDEFDAQQVDFRILLSHCDPDESRQLARTHPEFDAIVMAQSFSDPDPAAETEKIGSTMLLQVGHKGKHVGILGLYGDDAETPVRFQLIPMERSEFEDAPSMISYMQEYQQRLFDERIVLTDGVISHPSGASFVGATKCGECHTQAFEIWEKSHHAHAFESLDPAYAHEGHERLNGIARMHDPECLSCHVTGWNPQEYIRYRSGFLNQEFAETEEEGELQSRLTGNQCENCHGPGSQHIELIESGDLDLARQEVNVTLEQGKSACYDCHDTDNSPDFDFDKYWPDIEHYGME